MDKLPTSTGERQTSEPSTGMTDDWLYPVEVASCFDWDPRAKLSTIQETALRKCIADTSKAVLWDYEDDVGVAVGSETEASVNEGKQYTLLKCNKYVVELWLKGWTFDMIFELIW